MEERKLIRGVLCYVLYEGKYVMIHRMHKPKDIHYGLWVAPGGKLEDEDFDQCTKREIREEIGVELTDLIKLGKVFFDNKERLFNGELAGFDYECEVYTGVVNKKPSNKDDNGNEVGLFLPEEILSLPQHDCDKHLYLLVRQGKRFNMITRYNGEKLAQIIVDYE